MYRLGTSLGTLTPISELGIHDPHSYPMRRSARFENASGGYADIGWLEQEWRWGYLPESQINVLRDYEGEVYVCTKDNSGAWKVYTAVLVWPEQEPEHYSGHVLDFSVTFRNLIYVCDEEDL